jgi:hypothetical protein
VTCRSVGRSQIRSTGANYCYLTPTKNRRGRLDGFDGTRSPCRRPIAFMPDQERIARGPNLSRKNRSGPRVLVLRGFGQLYGVIERAGFKAYFIGGFPLVGARDGVPDIGLMGLGEIGSGIRDIVSACDLPVLVDCDNGYGGVKIVVHVINFYERLGARPYSSRTRSPRNAAGISPANDCSIRNEWR